jgi:hypothetical protein
MTADKRLPATLENCIKWCRRAATVDLELYVANPTAAGTPPS